jgi:hypothetical protein
MCSGFERSSSFDGERPGADTIGGVAGVELTPWVQRLDAQR